MLPDVSSLMAAPPTLPVSSTVPKRWVERNDRTRHDTCGSSGGNGLRPNEIRSDRRIPLALHIARGNRHREVFSSETAASSPRRAPRRLRALQRDPGRGLPQPRGGPAGRVRGDAGGRGTAGGRRAAGGLSGQNVDEGPASAGPSSCPALARTV